MNADKKVRTEFEYLLTDLQRETFLLHLILAHVDLGETEIIDTVSDALTVLSVSLCDRVREFECSLGNLFIDSHHTTHPA